MKANVVYLGQMEYGQCTELQQNVLERVSSHALDHTLLIVEHDPVLTLGASFHKENLLLSEEQFKARGISIYPTDRGGDVTYHGPKQLVAYPIFDVSLLGKDLHKWLRDIEQVIINVMSEYDLEGYRFPPNTGVWIKERKIAAIGIKIKRWISMHGLALNCNNDLSPFQLIVPCGIKSHGVTSLSKELGREVTVDEVGPKLVDSFAKLFALDFTPMTIEDLHSRTLND